jgi:hypothetical protein
MPSITQKLFWFRRTGTRANWPSIVTWPSLSAATVIVLLLLVPLRPKASVPGEIMLSAP